LRRIGVEKRRINGKMRLIGVIPSGLTYLKLGDKTSAMEQYRLLKEWNSILAERLLKQINEAQ
jgi:hypothetical protein